MIRRGDRSLVHISNIDREAASDCRGISAGGPHKEGVTARGFVVQSRTIGDGDNSGDTINREPSPRGIIQRPGDRVDRRIVVKGTGCDSHDRSVDGILVDSIKYRVGIGDQCRIKLINVDQTDRVGLICGRTV